MNIDDIMCIHEFLVKYFHDADDPISPPGVKHQELLESAISRPFQSAGGRDCYNGIYLKSAALFHSLINNHPFHNGNKRTALSAIIVLLDSNGIWLDKCDDDELYEFTRKVAAHDICDERDDELEIISNWIQQNSRKRIKGEQRLKFYDLKEILSKFDYEVDPPTGKTVKIKKDGQVVTTILKKGLQGFEEYDQVYINELRKRLNLTEENGIDSLRFYGQKGISDSLNEFMRIRGNVLERLAKI